MSRFRHVLGHDANDQGPSAQALARALDELYPGYEAALAQANLPGRISAAVRCHDDDRPKDDVLVLVYDDGRPEDHELVVVKVPPGVDEAGSHDVTRLAAAVLTTGLTRLGQVLQWDRHEASDVLKVAQATAVDDLPPAGTTWVVCAEGRGVNAPEQPHELTFVGAGPVSSRTRAYDEAFAQRATALDTEEYRAWWSGAPVPIGEIPCRYDGDNPGVRVRLGRRVIATIERPVATIEPDYAAELARTDLDTVLARLSQRLDLGPPPTVRPGRHCTV